MDFTIVYKEKCMKIKNALWGPLAIDLGKRNITMKPRGTATITNDEFKSPSCQKLLQEEKVFVLPEEL